MKIDNSDPQTIKKTIRRTVDHTCSVEAIKEVEIKDVTEELKNILEDKALKEVTKTAKELSIEVITLIEERYSRYALKVLML
jgi:hypothetical protein